MPPLGQARGLGKLQLALGGKVGVLLFQSEPLSRVLQDVNRYAPKPITLDDPSIGDLMITGTVVRNDVSGWVSLVSRNRCRYG